MIYFLNSPDLEYLELFVSTDPEHPLLILPGPTEALTSLEDVNILFWVMADFQLHIGSKIIWIVREASR